MKFFVLKSKDPYLNLAIEEYLFRNESEDVFMLWQNEPTVVIGKNQNAYTEINMDVLNEKGIKIARRITGGGAVYHDGGNLNYTFISSEKSEKGIDFEYFTRPIVLALESIGIKAELSGRNDLLTDGKKFSGNAQYSFGGRVLHHGTLLFNSDLSVLSEVLNVDKEKILSKGIRSTRSRVINICELLRETYDIEDFIELIRRFVIDYFSPSLCEVSHCEAIEALRARNASSEWLFPERAMLSSYSVKRKKKYPFGIVDISLDMSKDILRKIRISGDFFGSRPISELEDILENTRLCDLSEKLSGIDLEEYIYGMSPSELEELIVKG